MRACAYVCACASARVRACERVCACVRAVGAALRRRLVDGACSARDADAEGGHRPRDSEKSQPASFTSALMAAIAQVISAVGMAARARKPRSKSTDGPRARPATQARRPGSSTSHALAAARAIVRVAARAPRVNPSSCAWYGIHDAAPSCVRRRPRPRGQLRPHPPPLTLRGSRLPVPQGQQRERGRERERGCHAASYGGT